MSALSLRTGAAGGASGAFVVALLQAFTPYRNLPLGAGQPFAQQGSALVGSAARLFEAVDA
eukprot:16432490-Heterocapsa_arctica.AAC.1